MSIDSSQQSIQLHRWLSALIKNSETISWLFLFGLFAIQSAYWIVAPLDCDVAFYLYGANRMLEGARLYVDVIDVNPPLIFYLNALPTLIANLLGWSHAITFKLSFVTLALLSFVLSARLTRESASLAPDWMRKIFLLALAFVFFLIIEDEFGEREHLMFVLVMPYILGSIGCAEGRPLRGTFAVFIGALAGLGMAIKPHFLLLWVAIEVYLQLANPKKSNWRRPENRSIAMVLMTYGVVVLLLSYEYFGIAAMGARVYGAYRHLRFIDLLTQPAIRLWIFGLVTFVAARFNPQNRATKEVLFTASTSFLLIAMIQQKGWRYHFYPAQATVILLLTITVPQLLDAFEAGREAIKGEVLSRLTGENLRIPRILRVAASVVLIILALGLYKPILTPIRIAYWSVDAAYNVAKGRTLLREAVSTLFQNSFEEELRPSVKQLIPLVEEYANRKPILVLSTSMQPAFPLVNYTNAIWSSRFSCLWLLPGSYQNLSLSQAGSLYHTPNQMDDIERFLFQAVISDMAKEPPALLIVESSPSKLGFGQTKFDYIDYFSQDARFTSLLSQYDLLTKKTSSYGSYDIYKRRDT
jgi:hypothetical protein